VPILYYMDKRWEFAHSHLGGIDDQTREVI
jgi:hypothetical protein